MPGQRVRQPAAVEGLYGQPGRIVIEAGWLYAVADGAQADLQVPDGLACIARRQFCGTWNFRTG